MKIEGNIWIFCTLSLSRPETASTILLRSGSNDKIPYTLRLRCESIDPINQYSLVALLGTNILSGKVDDDHGIYGTTRI